MIGVKPLIKDKVLFLIVGIVGLFVFCTGLSIFIVNKKSYPIPSEKNCIEIYNVDPRNLESSATPPKYLDLLLNKEVVKSTPFSKEILPVDAGFNSKTNTGNDILGIDSATGDLLVNNRYFSELKLVNVVNLKDPITVGYYRNFPFSDLMERDVYRFLITSSIISTYSHLGSRVCLEREFNDELSYRSTADVNYDYCTNECVADNFRFDFHIDKQTGKIWVEPWKQEFE